MQSVLGFRVLSRPLANNMGVFQGSVLGPLLFTILSQTTYPCTLREHFQYANDTQVLVSKPKHDPAGPMAAAFAPDRVNPGRRDTRTGGPALHRGSSSRSTKWPPTPTRSRLGGACTWSAVFFREEIGNLACRALLLLSAGDIESNPGPRDLPVWKLQRERRVELRPVPGLPPLVTWPVRATPTAHHQNGSQRREVGMPSAP